MAAGLTQKQVAEALGIDSSAVSRFESGEKDLTAEQTEKLVELLEHPPVDDNSNPRVSSLRSIAQFQPPGERAEFERLLASVLPFTLQDCTYQLQLAIDVGPAERVAGNEATIVALALVAAAIVTDPVPVDDSEPMSQNDHHVKAPHHHPPGGHGLAMLPMGIPRETFENFLRYSPRLPRTIEALAKGPTHERAALGLVLNLIQQIRIATRST